MPRQFAELLDYGSGIAHPNTISYEESLSSGDYLHFYKDAIAPARRVRRRDLVIAQEDSAIEQEITASAFILAIKGEDVGEDDFVPYSDETWKRATTFLRRLVIHAHSCGFSGIGIPAIIPADAGAISLYWKDETKSLLMTFPADVTHPVSYYGKKSDRENAGRFSHSNFTPDLIYWLAIP